MNPQSCSQTPLNIMSSFLTQPNFNLIDPNSLYLQPYFPTLSGLMALRAQAQKSAQIADNYKVEALNDVKSEFPLKFESKCEYIPEPTKLEPSDKDMSLEETGTTTPSYIDQPPSSQLNKAEFKLEIEKMVRYLLSNMGKDKEALIGNTRNFYLQNSSLLEVYDKISMKYYSAKKCKEDLIRYILRKIFRHIRTSIMRKEKVSSKKASLLMCKRYFQANIDPSVAEIEDEDKLLESLMPYNKNSKNKTMNISFILEIFSSASFCQEYQEFLPELNTLIVQENKKKEAKLVKFIIECVEKNCLEKLGANHRMPWLDVWTEDAKNLAIAIMPNKRLIYNAKKSKF